MDKNSMVATNSTLEAKDGSLYKFLLITIVMKKGKEIYNFLEKIQCFLLELIILLTLEVFY